jgi:prevent-host-death family protein
MAERTIDVADVQRVCFTLLKLVERDQEPITITKDGRPFAVLSPVRNGDLPQQAEG